MYDLVAYMGDIVWVTDRGSNIKKILEQFEVIFCATHRINNVLERTFFQHGKKIKNNKRNEQFFNQQDEEHLEEEDQMSDSDESNGEDDIDESIQAEPSQRIVQSRQEKQQNSRANHASVIKCNHLVITQSEIPYDAKRVLHLIISSKQLVKYVKLVFERLKRYIGQLREVLFSNYVFRPI